jgi:hypothetical protein
MPTTCRRRTPGVLGREAIEIVGPLLGRGWVWGNMDGDRLAIDRVLFVDCSTTSNPFDHKVPGLIELRPCTGVRDA